MKKLAAGLLTIAILFAIEFTVKGNRDLAYVYTIANLVGINIILAISLNLINGFTGQFSIGHAGFYAVGAYASAAVTFYGGPAIRQVIGFLPGSVQSIVFLFIGVAVAAATAGIAGVAVGIPSLRLRGDYLAIVTLGFGEIIRVLILNIDAIGGARGFSDVPRLSNFFWIYLAVVITAVTVHNLINSRFGRAFISIRDDEIAAEAMGVDTTRFKVLSFVISSMFAGVAGSLFGHQQGFLHHNSFQFTTSFYLIIMIVVGGLGSIEGAIVGAILVTVGVEALRFLKEFRLVAFSIVLILFMIYRPGGLLGAWTVSRKKKKALRLTEPAAD
jgi:branched-chain amino acid transport system permease protein